MAKAKFNLRNTKTSDKTPIYLKFHYKKRVLTYATNLYVIPKNWDFNKQRIKGYRAISKQNNSHLDFLELTLNGCFLELRQQGESITIDLLKTAFLKKIGIHQNTDKVVDYAISFDEQRNKSGLKSPLSAIIKHLKSFDENLYFEDLTTKFYYEFIEYCFDKNLSRGYINKLLTQLVIICNNAIKNKVTTKQDFKYFSKLKSNSENIHITTKQLSEMYHFKTDKKHLEAAKDVFVLMCCLGLRHSDWHQVRKENIKEIKGNMIFATKDQKTDNYIAVPLNLFPYTLPILKKYDFELPKLDYHSFLINIRKVAEELNWIKPIEKRIYKKKIITEIKRFCDEIGTHTARRSFVTNLKNRNFSNSDIMKMTGHKSTASFNKYDKQTAEDNAVLVAQSVVKLKAI
jgi:hypothetical protein